MDNAINYDLFLPQERLEIFARLNLGRDCALFSPKSLWGTLSTKNPSSNSASSSSSCDGKNAEIEDIVSLYGMKRRQWEIATICYCAIKNALNGHVHSSIRRLLSGYQTSRFYMCVVFSSLIVSCQGHGRNGKLESLNRNQVVLRSICALGIIMDVISPARFALLSRYGLKSFKLLPRDTFEDRYILISGIDGLFRRS